LSYCRATTTPLPLTALGPERQLSDYAEDLRRSSINTSSAEYWISHEHIYPLLSKVALDLISAPASQAYTERVFSVCGDMTAGKRNRLASGLERRVFLKMNSKYL
jgi:hypothetical protein